MKQFILLAFVLLCCGVSMPAQPAQNARSRAGLNELATTIQAELESHGERMLGHESYRWSTRLEKISGCRAELSVRVTSNLGETTVNTETVNFSMGALDASSILPKKTWLELSCAGQEKCIFSTTVCSKKTKDGIAIDCTTAGQKKVGSFLLQLDGDVAASSRLERAFRQAVDLCREPTAVTF